MLRSRTALHRALLTLLKRRQWDELSVRDIVAKAGVGYATFFRHYPTKGALLDEVAAQEIDRLVGLCVPALNTAGTRASSLAIFAYVQQHRTLWSALLTGGAAGAMREEFARIASEATADQIAHSTSWLPVELGLVYGVSATVEIIAWWLKQPMPLSIERIAEIHDRLILTPTLGTT
jgi:AcrR family transcriptional regulator